jgi:hypothetical protein
MRIENRRVLGGMIVTLWAASFASAQGVGHIQDVYRELMTNPPVEEIQTQALTDVLKPLDTALPDQVRSVLPVFESALEHENQWVQRAGASGFFMVSLARLDSAVVLSDSMDTLSKMLSYSDRSIVAMGLQTIAYLKPARPKEISATLLEFATREGVEPDHQVGAIAIAIHTAPNHPNTVPVALAFAERELPRSVRIKLIDSIGLRGPRGEFMNPLLYPIVHRALRNEEAIVRERAIYNLVMLGRDEVLKEITELSRLRVADPDDDVRAEADRALQTLGGANYFGLLR